MDIRSCIDDYKRFFTDSDKNHLYEAIRRRQNHKVRKLLHQGADINDRNFYGESVLYYAVKSKNYEIVRLLIDRGADLEQPTNSGLTPLGYTILIKDNKFFEILLESGADVNGKNLFWAPLGIATATHDLEYLQVLMHFGANLNLEILHKIYYAHIYDDDGIEIFKYCIDLFLTFHCNHDSINNLYNYKDNNDNIPEDYSRFFAKKGFKDDKFSKLKQSDYYKECTKELEIMKSITFDNGVTLYNFLTASRNKLINYLKNRKLCDTLERLLNVGKFKIYKNMLRINGVIGSRYGRLYEKVRFYDPTGRYSLPILVRDNVLQYLNERDINNFIRAQSLR